MTLKNKIKLALIGISATWSISAHADLYVFGFSDFNHSNGLNITTASGDFFVPVSDSGWWSSLTGHDAINKNYLAGVCNDCSGVNHNNYFTFDLSEISGTVISASLNLFNYRIAGSAIEYQLYDINSPLSAVRANGGSNNPVYNDLMTGISYGSIVYDQPNKLSTISLNTAGILALNNALGGEFGVGGSVTGGIDGPPSPPPIPEPETYAMLLAGLGLIGLMSRRRKQEKLR